MLRKSSTLGDVARLIMQYVILYMLNISTYKRARRLILVNKLTKLSLD